MEEIKQEFLELIPKERLSPEQRAFREKETHGFGIAIYQFVREPSVLDEILPEIRHCMSIWWKNGTIVCFSASADMLYQERKLFFALYDVGKHKKRLKCAIYGASNAIIAETAAWFWSLQHSGRGQAALEIGYRRFDEDRAFDFAAFHPEQLAQILDANPQRAISIDEGTWTAQQGVVLATRPYPLRLTFCSKSGFVTFTDSGTAFIEALEKQKSLFGSLCLGYVAFGMLTRENMERLYQLEMLDELKIRSVYKDQALLPFSAKVNSLDYFFDARCVRPEDFHSLDIPAKNLSVNVCSDVWEVCDQFLIAMLNRMTTLGHFTKFNLELALSCNVHYEDFATVEVTARIADALISFINANPLLTHLVFD
ncbi:hypothetical protein FisN_10Hh398 [Fistulifera solaris]|uniref:Uncharacterized protein n=1 Tax=Fistulifera solaris TaxID=1519565 RepID=A0A1Z5JQU1_FISSO|nr:hypothetical protein FisN_10Hh398 [Fistulifera solaris]|eukprot:GAX16384.1 hypothetical protein FisN_10Hh398 [Fistulifera solaris]